ncbi:2-hydroxy-3-oxopropionate reductase [Streptomyces sp. NPDC047002]|uniref:2-hydroxy-3-oxopropionate reductase n=1 Tax=Streptomyces sp. NPDC047002 TaxID=3155475 RepID=UPI003456CF88
METIAFIGLGVMGLPMAKNLVGAGHDVVGVNRSPARARLLAEQGGRSAATVADAVGQADVVITMLPDTPDVQDVVLGPGGVLENARSGALLIDASTIRPDASAAVADAAAAKGLDALDAPVSGGEAGAVAGTLSVMVGGSPAAFERALPILTAVGKTVVHVGPPGSGQTVKAANQLIVAGTLELLAEALVFLSAHGVDPAKATTVLAGGLAGSAVLDRKGPAMLDRAFEPGFRVDLHHKDMGIVTAAAREAGVAVPLGAAAAGLLGSLRAQGAGHLDHSALLLQVERLSGRENELSADE